MKKLLREIVALLLVCLVPCIYSMSEGGAGFDIGIGVGISGPVIELSRLEAQHEEEQTAPTQVGHEPGELLLGWLPLELAQKVLDNLSACQKQNIAKISRTYRTQAQSSITHLTILVNDINEEKLKDVECRFPNVKSLRITGNCIAPKQIELLASRFPHITSLNLQFTDINVAGVQALSQSGVFKYLKELNLSYNEEIGDAGIAELTSAPFTRKLESLDLCETGITSAGLASLAASNKFISLKKLNLSRNKIGDAGIAELIKAPFTHTLESLNLYDTHITSAGVATLAASHKLISLKKLNLEWNEIGDADVATLVEAPFACKLESLSLKSTDITSIGVATLATPNKLISLKELNLADNFGMWDQGITELMNASFIHKLESLSLQGTGITSAGVATLATPNKLIALKELNLSFNSQIDDASIAKLIEAPFTYILESLDLCETGITSAGVKLLVQQNALPALRMLNLADNLIGDEVIDALISAPFAGQLEELKLYGTRITKGIQQILLKSHIAKTIVV